MNKVSDAGYWHGSFCPFCMVSVARSLCLLTLLCWNTSAPGLTNGWQAVFGGTNKDALTTVVSTSDGGFLLGGYSTSGVEGNKATTNHGFEDWWLVKVRQTGQIEWEKSYGGTGRDMLTAAKEIIGEGFVVIGHSSSPGGTGNQTSTNYGSADLWILKLDQEGEKVWETSCGGTGMEMALAVETAASGHVLVAGWSVSTNGNKTSPNFGADDGWLVCLDPSGEKLWDKSYGGTSQDVLWAVQSAGTNGYVLAGSSSYSGFAGGNKIAAGYGSSDFWVVWVDAEGNLLSDKSYGGIAAEYLYACYPLPDGGFLLGGSSASPPSGTKIAPFYGGYLGDYWLVRIDKDGDQIWDRSFGGSGEDYLYGLAQTLDGGFLLAGVSGSPADGNKKSTGYGQRDIWLVRIDQNGNYLGELAHGGTLTDNMELQCLTRLQDGGFLVAANSESPKDGSKTVGSYGGGDFWVTKFGSWVALPPPKLAILPQSQQDIPNQGFRFQVSGWANQLCVIESSTNLNLWSPLQTNVLSSTPWEWTDNSVGRNQHRVYRARIAN